MKLFEVTNGYTGYSYVRLLVIADNRKKAIKKAKPKFKKEVDKAHTSYKEDYYKKLEAKSLCKDTTKEWVQDKVND